MHRDYSFAQAMQTQLFPLLFGGIFGGVGLFVSLIFILVGGAPWVDWQLDSSSAATIDAQVEKIHIEPNMRVNGRHPTAIHYSFEINGKRYRGKSRTLNHQLIEAAKENKSVAVLHLPQNPQINKIVGTNYSFFGYFCLFPLAFSVVGGALFMYGFFNARAQYRLVHEGAITTGKVTAMKTNPYTRSHRRNQLVITYEFTAPTHETFSNSYRTFDYDRYGNLSVGSEVSVIYDEFFPRRNTLVSKDRS